MSRGGLKSIVLWVLPNYAALVVLITLSFQASFVPLRVQHTLEGWWMLFALFLPITTIVAAVKAVQLSLRAGGEQLNFWRPVAGWGLVAFALAFNVFSYVVISTRTSLKP
jgi:hypothetical protein